MKRWFISPVIGSGISTSDAFRAKIFDLGVNVHAKIPHNPDGTPRFNWALCLCSAADFSVADADTTIEPFPGVTVDDLLSSIPAASRNRIQNFLIGKGVDLTGITLQSTVGDVIQRVMNRIGATDDFRKMTVPE